MAVVALGGYARRELCPASDVDLLLLHDGWGRRDLSGLVETLCYPLWDAKLSVGHSVRTPAEAVADAGSRIDTATALLDRRLVAGDRGLFDGLSSRVPRWTRRNGKSLLRQLAGADEARHHESGAHPGMLEPDLKNGAGGLRDVHSLRWAAALLLDELGLDPLVAAGYLSPDDRRVLARANTTLLAVRCALHQVASTSQGKAADVLRLDQQDEVAASLDAPDADALLRNVGLAMRAVAHLHNRTWDLVLADATAGRRRRRPHGRDLGRGLSISAGLVDIDEVDLRADPAIGLRAMAVAAEHGGHLSRPAAAALARQMSELERLPWDDDARRALLDLLSAGDGVSDALAEADHVGLLAAHLPEWHHVRGRPQRNALHRYDLDSHGAEAVVALHALRRDDTLRRIWERLDHPDSLVLATWLHDVGKAWPGDHSEAGAEVARSWLHDMGFLEATSERVARLVRHHLLLPDVATRRDLDDASEIEFVAKVVGDTETLDALYLLTLADGRATGPAAWSPWKDNLLATLHERVRRHLTGAPVDVPGSRGLALDPGVSPPAFAALSRIAPDRYFEVADVDQIAVHARLLVDGGGRGVDVRRGAVEATTVVSVVADDRAGLLADCAGVLAAADLAVVEARALTGAGIALDWFTVTGDADPAALTETLNAVLDDRLDVADVLSRPRWGRPEPPPISRRVARVVVRDDETVEVEGPNRPALLYRLCRAVTDAGFAIHTVRAATLGPSVFDVFEVRKTTESADLDVLRNLLMSAAEGAN